MKKKVYLSYVNIEDNEPISGCYPITGKSYEDILKTILKSCFRFKAGKKDEDKNEWTRKTLLSQFDDLNGDGDILVVSIISSDGELLYCG